MARRRSPFDRHHAGDQFVTEFLHTLGIVDLIATPIGVVLLLAFRVSGDAALTATFVTQLFLGFGAGVTLGGLLLGLAALLRYGHSLARARGLTAGARAEVDQPVTYQAETVTSSDRLEEVSDDGIGDGETGKQVLALLREIRDLTLLPPEQRERISERVRANQQRHAAELIVDAINLRQIGKARRLLAEAEASYGSTATFERLRDKINESDARNEPLDFARTKRLIEQAAADGNWSVAEQMAHAAYTDHPESSRCRKLWEDARRARLHAHVQESADHHHWDEALAAAREFLERFPDSPEASALHDQLDTLEANAEIVHRRHYENRFKELVGARHYAEALRVANHVVEAFPESPQARALREQIPALKERLATG